MKIKSLRNPEITLSFTDICESCPSHIILASQICLLILFAKISRFTVYPKSSTSHMESVLLMLAEECDEGGHWYRIQFQSIDRG